jgi:RNA polymerase sigma-70 factor (ECF subfamily)
LRELFDAEYPALVRLATLITGDAAVAEDVVQEAFARALARWKKIQHYDKPGAWVRRVVIRLAIRTKDKRAREMHAPVPEQSVVDAAVDPDLVDALATLPRNQRAAIVLFYLEGCTTEEVAAALDVPASTARSHLHRGRAALAQRLAITEMVNDWY